ncbi:uncharacterized protein LOC143292891 [Babylonia areolata]|uniref:uncharacterized protein LOC143292891 n=1 Tax=Babylonia areolata TaxID=304850 RepID=UPI003FD2A53C
MMRTTSLLTALVIIALCQALPTRSHSRQKRGFRMNSSNRVAHGFGKRQSDLTTTTTEDRLFSSLPSSDLMTVKELAQLAVDNPSLSQALIEKFVDTDGDGIVTTQELFGLTAAE